MKNFKKLLTLAAVVIVTAAIAVVGTLAYLTDRDSKVNTFTVGDVAIELTEEFEQGATLVPGVNIEKKPVITNTGKNDAWVWLTFSIPSALDNYVQGSETGSNENVIHWNPLGATTEGYVTDARVEKAIADGHLPAGTTADDIKNTNKTWNVFNSLGEGQNAYQEEINGVKYNTYVLLYNKALTKGETTLPNITKVFLDAQVDITPEGDWYKVNGGAITKLAWNSNEDGNPEIYVCAYAVQAEGFANAQDAYKAYQTQWGDNGKAEIPEVYNGVIYSFEGNKATAESAGGTTVYRGVFSDGQTNATTVEIGEGIERLNNRAICKAPTVTTISLPNSLTYIDEGAMQQSAITSIVIPENVTYMGKTALGACAQLEKIEIKAKNITFANYVARDCKALKEVYIYSDSVTFESGSMYFTNAQTGDASAITFYVSNQAVADALFNSSSASRSYGMLIKSIDGATTYYNTLK